ncbi:methylated-DNA--[protein]-cysteine S-methyltransferase [Haloferax denitrificans]|uniref:Methylated-DNA--protein-cysteine methyltransferase n=1 Tax=Haloferax denitrificans ATCC 35960 TaxID=662478 RepID=M0IXP3_9EURY|nr:methylated-DNA--[protein]-cysteine S-methyltransferase [Haloferax denitrificans]EMA00539.1 methylated-DNA--protein-cysteine methyltransferase [Haloferax denitrificans ATCC 35960]
MRVTMWEFAVDVDERLVGCSADSLRNQLAEYEDGERREFDIEVRFPDSFTGDVMRVMASIPYGETRTYGEVAAELDSHAVAVGQACGRNPVPLVVPCHRVVGADSLGGFSAAGGVDLKRALLDHERGAVQTGLDAF